MSKENVTDFTVRTETTYLTISEDGQIEVPLSLEAMEKLLAAKDCGMYGRDDRTLVLLAKEILSLRLKNRELLKMAERKLDFHPVLSATNCKHSAWEIGGKFSYKCMEELVKDLTSAADSDWIKQRILSGMVHLRNQIIAFLEQNNEPNTD